ncbi:MAG: helix-turn-helix domain-containing protein [Rhodospirillales bacterium]|nr:helix-turn-helix domain-containing protein [Rhodospirillales bacterium]
MNKLPAEKRAQILGMMVEGMSIRSITRLTGVSKNTVAKLLRDAGCACAAYQDRTLRNLPCKRLQLDEIWSFVYAKQKNVATAKRQDLAYGDVWTWTALCADTKLVPSWLVGGRDADYANAFVADLASRLAHRVQLTSDGHKPYLQAVEDAFSKKVENHMHALAIYFMHYNFVRIHQTTRITPAMAAGVSQTLWSLADIVRVVDEWEATRS